jgi:hypothetical protein
MWGLSWLFPKRQTQQQVMEQAISTNQVVPQVNWRTSEGYHRLLYSFVFPSTPSDIPIWVDWPVILGEPVDVAIRRLRDEGALLVADDPRSRISYKRSAKDLKQLCKENGLKVSGTKEEMVERLALMDTTGHLLGYSGELLKCSPDAATIARAWQDITRAKAVCEQQFGVSLEAFADEKERLSQQFPAKGHSAPSDDDVGWGLMNKKAMQHAAEGNLGLCRNTYLSMADFLLKRDKSKEALRLYLIVCSYDLNGAENRGILSAEMLQEFPLFDRASATLAPVVLKKIQALSEKLKLSSESLMELYLEYTSSLNFPLSPDKTWAVLYLAVEGKINLDDQPHCFNQIRSLLGQGK